MGDTMTKTFDDLEGEDVIDVRDLIARLEELESERKDLESAIDDATTEAETDERRSALSTWDAGDEAKELKMLLSLMDDLKGKGGDEQWRGDWYPITLIRDSYFEDYARELAEDAGDVKDDARWPHNCIDWAKAAHLLRQDYTSLGVRGVDYWTR